MSLAAGHPRSVHRPRLPEEGTSSGDHARRPAIAGMVARRSAEMLLPAPAGTRRSLPRPHLPARLSVSALPPATVGRLIIVVAFLAAGVGSTLAKSAYALGATPVSFLLIRLLTAVAVLALLTGPSLWRIGARRIGTLVVLGLAFGGQTLAYYNAVQLSPVALVVVVVSSYPIVVIALDAIADRTVPSPLRIATMVASLTGLWLAAGSPVGRPDAGVLLALVSATGYAVYLRISARVLAPSADGRRAGIAPMVGTFWVMLGALLVIVVVGLLTAPAMPQPAGVGLAVVHGVLSTIVPIVGVYAALQRLTTSEVAVLGPLEPIVATGIAGLVLGETLTGTQTLGVVLVVVAVAQLSGIRPRVGLPRLPFALAKLPRRPAGARPAVRVPARTPRRAMRSSGVPATADRAVEDVLV